DRPECLADILRQHRGRGLVTGEQAKRLDVEEEVVGRAFRPEARDLGTGHGVVAAVYFDDRELSSVIAKSRLRALCFSRGEPARVDEALVGPGRGADADVGHFPWGCVLRALLKPRWSPSQGHGAASLMPVLGGIRCSR